jgi:hypothetical protein
VPGPAGEDLRVCVVTVIIPLIMPPPPPRREIKRNGIVYREVLPGDDDTSPWWKIPLILLAFLFVFVPAMMAFVAFFFFPLLGWFARHAGL